MKILLMFRCSLSNIRVCVCVCVCVLLSRCMQENYTSKVSCRLYVLVDKVFHTKY